MRLFLLLSFNVLTLLDAFTDVSDRQALLEFKSQISQGKRDVLYSWNNSLHVCNWKGVTCGRKHKRVTQLHLPGLQLGGVISPSIGNLSFLISLNISRNSFGGTIPDEVGNLFRLEHLDMNFNLIEGEIPASLSNCSRLLELQFSSNLLGGGVPSELWSLTKLVTLDLYGNNLKGKLPDSLGNLTCLRELGFGGNNIDGRVPDNIVRLNRMVYLDLSDNNFLGFFPPPVYNLSSLYILNIFRNSFSGSLRPDFGNLLPNLQGLYMGRNYFTGAIPTTFSNISNLQKLGMEFNNLTGSIPPSFGKLRNLELLSLHSNSLGSGSFGDLEFFGALTNCTKLEILEAGRNRLGGDLPTSIGNMSRELNYLSLDTNFITGSIPHEIGNLVSLQSLWLEKNLLSGPLPTSLGKLLGLMKLSLYSNRISKHIPPYVGNLSRLESLYLYDNYFDGIVPPTLGNCSHLLELWIGDNMLNGTIPREIMQISPLLILSMPRNSFTGSLPEEVGRLENLVTLSLEDNKLSGQLPRTLGTCLSMEVIYLQGNSFDGAIPDIRGLVAIKEIDLSNNDLFGVIPGYLANFSMLQYLNLSVNNFEGRVPTEGNFQNASLVAVFGNKDLCGGIRELRLKRCSVKEPPMGTKHSSLSKKFVIGVSVGIALLFLLFTTSFFLLWFRKRKKTLETNNNPTPFTLGAFHENISYGDLQNATDGFSPNNLIGSGSFGTVFKALLPPENKVVAVKVLNMEKRGAMKSFMAECGSLKDIRHRNLVKLLTACASIDFHGDEFRALIYEFMPNGSLDMWLHPEEVEETRRPSRTLTLLERLNIVIDVASVLDYLHVHCHEPIAHCDLKPSNVLLDDDLTAHVSDFGLARLLLKFDQDSFFNQLSSAGVRGTIGYAAPEYGVGGKPSIYGDVYSFGVLVLEMFTGKRPTNELFGGNFTLQSYTMSALPERVLDIADKSSLHGGLGIGFRIAECLTLVLEVGLRCCDESPSNRLVASEAAKELISIREKFFKARRTARR
ncbi:PREDICTED: probable LRR receptor-like serine/threonine-protein kinase At3g47570 [Camelina sativa]|uniref:Probable LRR receptor-like serine/threonine-protein kinase At3g47570 n=1 Tax=Camelina sativa TaxID=90675 RepID=A0ABM0ZFL7_CAMSA|nr:PREDICTED: probable LRR receptor-like serine/threonine-protein kinase At3g47570 [Camelina sativa]